MTVELIQKIDECRKMAEASIAKSNENIAFCNEDFDDYMDLLIQHFGLAKDRFLTMKVLAGYLKSFWCRESILKSCGREIKSSDIMLASIALDEFKKVYDKAVEDELG